MNPWRSLTRLITTIDKIWRPSCIEVRCTFNDTLLLRQGSKYDSFNSNSDRQKKIYCNNDGDSWWVCSTYTERDNMCYIVSGNDSFLNVDATDSYYIAFGLCL